MIGMENKMTNPFDLKITCVRLTYSDKMKESLKYKREYEEIEILIRCQERNNIICNIACELKDNTLVLFHYNEHGENLYDQICKNVKEKNLSKEVILCDGSEWNLQQQLPMNDENIILASHPQVYNEKFEIPFIDNIVFAVPWKSEIINSHSIGEGLSLKVGKTHCHLYDLMDDLSTEEWGSSFARRAVERWKVYKEREDKPEAGRIKVN